MSRRGLPTDGNEILESTIAHYSLLDRAERETLLDRTDWLLRHKHWEAAGGMKLNDRIRVIIAGQAALLVLALSVDHYRSVSSVIVYPTGVIATGERSGPAGTRMSGPVAIHGLAAGLNGPVLIAWDQALEAARHPELGHNVVFHEFAHKIDAVDGLSDGTPPLGRRDAQRWADVCTPIFEDIREGLDHPPLRPYAGTNPAEFFAVATETFFDTPGALRQQEPVLYGILAEFYQQDPASRAR